MVYYIQGSDESLLQKLHQNHSKNKNYLMSKSSRAAQFGISHFAGNVYYNVKGMYYY